ERNFAIEAADLLGVFLARPVLRSVSHFPIAPGSARVRPELAPRVAAVLHEGREGALRDRKLRHGEGLDPRGMGPFLVVEREGARLPARAEIELPRGERDVARGRARRGRRL